MSHNSTRYFELAQARGLLSQEWSMVRDEATRIPSGPALSLAPVSPGREAGLRSHPAMVHLHPGDGCLEGDFCCQPDALPIETDTIQLLVARHALDLLEMNDGIAAEWARVLAPGGTLLLFGMNVLTPWRLWNALNARDVACTPKVRNLRRVRRQFAKAGLHSVRSEFLGGIWPGDPAEAGMGPGGRFDGAWFLVLAKQRSVVRAIPLRRRGNAMALGHGLAQMPSRRACL